MVVFQPAMLVYHIPKRTNSGAHNLFLLRGAHRPSPFFRQLRCKTQTFKSFWYDTRTFTSAEERCVTSKVFKNLKKRKLRVGEFRWLFTDLCFKKTPSLIFMTRLYLSWVYAFIISYLYMVCSGWLISITSMACKVNFLFCSDRSQTSVSGRQKLLRMT